MGACSFNRLLRFLNEKLDLNSQLEVYRHLDSCEICRDAVGDLSRDRENALSSFRARPTTPVVLERSVQAARGFPRSAR